MGADYSQVYRLAADFTAAGARMTVMAPAVVAKTCAHIEAGAKSRAAVDTGAMRASVSTTLRGLTGEVGPTVPEYPVYVELGTSRMAAQPFMGPATVAAEETLPDGIGKILDRGI